MDKETKKAEPFFTPKRKAIAAAASLAAAVIFCAAMPALYMEFFSLFMMSETGSTVFLVMIAAAVTFPQNFISSKAIRADVSVPLLLLANIIGMVCSVFLFSIFRYTKIIYLISGLLAHFALTGLVFTRAKAEVIPKIKEKKSKVGLFFSGVLSAVLADIIYFLLFLGALHFFMNYAPSSNMHY